MTQHEAMHVITETLNDFRAGILTTIGPEGFPECRWMSPTVLNGHPNSLFVLTEPNSHKLRNIIANPHVEWMIQTREVEFVINIRGKMSVVQNTSLYRELLEVISMRPASFWRIKNDQKDFVILETKIEVAKYYYPMKNRRFTVAFAEDGSGISS